MKLGNLLRLFRMYETGKFVYTKLLKPAYLELRKDAYALDADKRTVNRKKKKSNAINQKPKRSHKRQPNT
ncbi:MAG: hypothetical protein U0V74_15085 [Chitinophagales bacterium]